MSLKSSGLPERKYGGNKKIKGLKGTEVHFL
jgi:hypothetical protein